MHTLRPLLSVLFYLTTWSEFFKKSLSIKRTGPSQKKLIVLFYFRAATANFWSLLNNLVWSLKKVSIKRPVLSFFQSTKVRSCKGGVLGFREFMNSLIQSSELRKVRTSRRHLLAVHGTLNIFFKNKTFLFVSLIRYTRYVY